MKNDYRITFSKGQWQILADGEGVYPEASQGIVSTQIDIPPSSGVVLRRIK